MLLIILISFFSIIGLMVIHEFGHFILAKKFGVKVEEFGIGYPPRIFGKKIGQTIYSINLLPFGAFVKIYGESERTSEPWSFTNKPFWQRALIMLGGIISFWLVSVVIFSIVMAIGVPTGIDDETSSGFENPKVQIYMVASGSPAEKAGFKIGDTILNLKSEISNLKSGNSASPSASPTGESGGPASPAGGLNLKITKVKEIQDFVDSQKGNEIIFTIQRGNETFDVSLTPRISPPDGEGPIGIALVRTAIKHYPWYISPFQGFKAAIDTTWMVIDGWWQMLSHLTQGQSTGAQLMGPVGIFGLFVQTGQLGINYFLQLIAIISIYLALFNLIPIPVTDGGKLLYLVIEKIRGRKISQKIEKNVDLAIFALLILLMIWVTIKDVERIFF